MISRDENPDFLNSFLDYTITILNKSPNSVKEYNYDIANFLKYMKKQFKLADEANYKDVKINDEAIFTTSIKHVDSSVRREWK